MDIRKVLEDLNFLFKEKSIISESSYKQSIFMNFFLSLGYINDYNKGIEEIKFEISDGNNGKIDILVGDKILVEVKSSNISIENNDIFIQTFGYNSLVGKEIVIITNFKKMNIYLIGKNNLLASLDLINYSEETIKMIYLYLSPYSMNAFQNFIGFMKSFRNFIWNKFNFNESFNEFTNTYFKECPLVLDGYNYNSFIAHYLNLFRLNLNCIDYLLKNKYHSTFIKIIDYLEKLNEYIDRSYILDNDNIYGTKFPNVDFIQNTYTTIFEELKNIEDFLLSIASLNIFIFYNNLDEANDYWNDYLYNQG